MSEEKAMRTKKQEAIELVKEIAMRDGDPIVGGMTDTEIKDLIAQRYSCSEEEPNEESLWSIREAEGIISQGGTGRSFSTGRALLDAALAD